MLYNDQIQHIVKITEKGYAHLLSTKGDFSMAILYQRI
jgi:hypothetical protein